MQAVQLGSLRGSSHCMQDVGAGGMRGKPSSVLTVAAHPDVFHHWVGTYFPNACYASQVIY